MNTEEAKAQSAMFKIAYDKAQVDRQKELFDDALKRLETREAFLAERDGQIVMYRDLTLLIDVAYEITMRIRMGD